MSKSGHTIESIEAELRKTKGMVAIAARQLGLTRQGLYFRINRSARLQQLLQEEREVVTDSAELKLYQAIMNGDMIAVKYYLSTQGRTRGYVIRTETDLTSDGQRLDFTLKIGNAGPSGDGDSTE